SPTSIESTLVLAGTQSATIYLSNIPSAARLTAKILLDNKALLMVRVLHVTVYNVELITVFDEGGDGVGPGSTTVEELVEVSQSDGITPVNVGIKNRVKVEVGAHILSAGFDRASGDLLITGDTWDPISVPLTFKRGSEVATDFAPLDLTARQGGAATTTITVR